VKLPNYDRPVVPKAKMTGYLLSSTHRDGWSKTAFFVRRGFSAERWEELATALQQHATDYNVARVEDSPFGTRYIIEGALATPDGRVLPSAPFGS
jgi:hypothetical protein